MGELLESCSVHFERSYGTRVFYDGPQPTDHNDAHNEDWRKALEERNGVETGVLHRIDETRTKVTVMWDCGTRLEYGRDKWCQLRILDCAATGLSECAKILK